MGRQRPSPSPASTPSSVQRPAYDDDEMARPQERTTSRQGVESALVAYAISGKGRWMRCSRRMSLSKVTRKPGGGSQGRVDGMFHVSCSI